MEIEVVLDTGATIGESPTWSAAEKALYWIDVKKPALYRYEPETGDQRTWLMTSDIGAFGLVADPPGAVPVQPPPVGRKEHGPVDVFPDGQVDRPGSTRCERNGDALPALREHGEGAVPTLAAPPPLPPDHRPNSDDRRSAQKPGRPAGLIRPHHIQPK